MDSRLRGNDDGVLEAFCVTSGVQLTFQGSNFSKATVALCTLALAAPWAWAHGDEVIPDESGFKFGAQAAVAWRRAAQGLPSQSLPGYLLQGDPGVDSRGTHLEHAVLQLGYRPNEVFGAQLAMGAHGHDPWHIEGASLQAKGAAWTLELGRQRPSLGKVMTPAGHFDRFGLMPLAKQALTHGDWLEDGAQLNLKRTMWGADWTLDAGLWVGHSFPGTPGTQIFPSAHLGAQWHGMGGQWLLDGFMAKLDPKERASQIPSNNGTHTHAAPVCDASLNGVVCFDGSSRLMGFSAQWKSQLIPVSLQGAWLWRHEQGILQSANGVGQYGGRTGGQWLQAVWQMHAQWETALRFERLKAQHNLVGAGATLVASEAGFDPYSPQRRTAAMLGYSPNQRVTVRLEVGREKTNAQRVNFGAVRLGLKI
jgi:hypothetical protein